jgi:peptidoglycan/LPS O-acetylase OafA/YrhL
MPSSLEIILPPDYPARVKPRPSPHPLAWLLGRAEPVALGRLGVIDLIRGFVCLNIMIGHNGLPPALQSAVPAFQVWNANRPGVECFMVLSGFFLAHMLRSRAEPVFSVGGFLRGRLLRLALPLWVALAVMYGVWAAVAVLSPAARAWPTPAGALAEFLFLSDVAGTPYASYTYWSLAALFQAYFIWSAVFWLVRRRHLRTRPADHHRRTLGVLTALAAGLFVVGVWRLGGGGWFYQTRWLLVGQLAYLAAGWLVYQVAVGRAGRWVVPACVLALAGVAVVQVAVRPLFAAALLLVLVGAAALGDVRPPAGARWLAAVGRWSFSIYLTHGMIGHKLFLLTAAERWPVDGWTVAGVAAATVAAGVLLGAVFHRLVEAPLARFARGASGEG